MTKAEQSLFSGLKQEQRQTITAAQLQSLHLLAMPIQELESYIDECLLNNPVLELDPWPEDKEAGEDVAPVVVEGDSYCLEANSENYSSADQPDPLQQVIDRSSEDSLRSLLNLQAAVMKLPAAQEQAVKCVISALDADGYLRLSLAELNEAFGINQDLLEQAIGLIQGMEPKGVAARNLGECLRLQTPESYPFIDLVEAITKDYLPQLAANDVQYTAQGLGATEKEIRQVFGFLRSLNPYPVGELDGGEGTHYIVPDVVVEAAGDSWRVHLNDQIYGGLSISSYYENLSPAQLPDDSSRNYVRQRMGEARDLLRAVKRRHETLLRLAGLLVRYQAGFLHLGPAGLKPFSMADLAAEADCHVSTVSRAAAGKYIQTPRGTYSWVYFFPQALPTKQGRYTTDAYVRMRISQLVSQEDQNKPLSDQAMTDYLQREGICISRRTVAKYRLDCAIPPRHLRRKRP